ncbi:hypothetical protein NDU88_005338 [Pleurodeles waltl]|uniref:Uncharacterized protein n=1 Tax=Pleurodeles waltl TaxID=8319 RepID=A0AAV7LKV1_PLEWA|nr:hypothetical protein NDU88_005338 [Pleurodeles waltl]
MEETFDLLHMTCGGRWVAVEEWSRSDIAPVLLPALLNKRKDKLAYLLAPCFSLHSGDEAGRSDVDREKMCGAEIECRMEGTFDLLHKTHRGRWAVVEEWSCSDIAPVLLPTLLNKERIN